MNNTVIKQINKLIKLTKQITKQNDLYNKSKKF